MLKKSRVTGAMDVNRLAAAVSRPGIDPRQWCTVGVVKAFHYDEEHGPYVDVSILADATTDSDGEMVEHVETARVGSFYAGPGYGFYAPLDVEDEVFVGYPDGNPNNGLVVIGKLWSNADLPPATAKDNQGDVCLHIKKDVTLRIQTFGSGNVVVGAENGKVLLGDETGTQPVHRKGDHSDVGTLTIAYAGPGAISGTYVDPDGVSTTITNAGVPLLLKGKANEGSSKVESS